LPELERRNEPRYYELLADALAAAGLSDARLADLSSRLRGTGIGDHDFTLWMTLRHRADEILSSHELDAFTKRAVALDEPTPSELLSMARLYAKGGAYADAAEHYSLLVANLLRRGGSGGMRRTVTLQGAGTMMVMSGAARVWQCLRAKSLRDSGRDRRGPAARDRNGFRNNGAGRCETVGG
ncbi:MAG: hypothetical protein J4F38_15685, partial [Pseudomonadales bacterium]|nr:hypothetical protein [Pseudomonadales bacterium]